MPGVLLTPQQQSTLAERIRRGDFSAEEELVRLFLERIEFLAVVRTRDRDLARDLAQDVMLAVVGALRKGQLRDPERLAAFVYGTARNLINNHLRTRSRIPRQDPIETALHLTATAVAVEDDERVSLVREAVGALNPTDRKVLLLTLLEGMKPAEIAARLGLTSEVVRARKSRAVKKLTERLKGRSRI